MAARDCCINCNKLKEINALYNRQLSFNKQTKNKLDSTQERLDFANEQIRSLQDRNRLLLSENEVLKNIKSLS